MDLGSPPYPFWLGATNKPLRFSKSISPTDQHCGGFCGGFSDLNGPIPIGMEVVRHHVLQTPVIYLSALYFVSANNLSHCEVVGQSGDADPQQAGQKISHHLLLE